MNRAEREFGHLSASGVKAAWRRCGEWRITGMKMSLKQWARWRANEMYDLHARKWIERKGCSLLALTVLSGSLLCASAAWAQQALQTPAHQQMDLAHRDVTAPRSSWEHLGRRIATEIVRRVIHQPAAPRHELMQRGREWWPATVRASVQWLTAATATADHVALQIWGGDKKPPTPAALRNLVVVWSKEIYRVWETEAPGYFRQGRLPTIHEQVDMGAQVTRAVSNWAYWAAPQTRGAERAALAAIARTTSAVAFVNEAMDENYQTLDELTNGQLTEFLKLVW